LTLTTSSLTVGNLLYAQKSGTLLAGGDKFTGPLHCLTDLVRREGVRGLFKGWLPNYCRLGPQTSITLVMVRHRRPQHVHASTPAMHSAPHPAR